MYIHLKTLVAAAAIFTMGCSSETRSDAIVGKWCHFIVKEHSEIGYTVSHEYPEPWNEEYTATGKMISSNVFGYSYNGGKLTIRDATGLRLSTQDVINETSDEIILKLTYLIDSDVPEDGSYAVLKKGECQTD